LSHATAEQVGDLGTGLAVGDPEHGGEAFIDALVTRLVAAALEVLALLRVEVNWLHRSPSCAALGPFGGGDCCSRPAGNGDGFAPWRDQGCRRATLGPACAALCSSRATPGNGSAGLLSSAGEEAALGFAPAAP